MADSFETKIDNLAAASNEQIGHSQAIVDSASTTMQTLINKTEEAQQQSTDFINSAREEGPYFLISRNQQLEQDVDPIGPDHFIVGPNIMLEKLEHVVTSKAWAERSANEQDIFRVLGKEDANFIDREFWIWRCSWNVNDVANPQTIYQRVTRTCAMTIGAITKLESGSVSGGFCHGITNEWAATGKFFERVNQDYINFHPDRSSGTGSFLFALPGAVAGYFDIEKNGWSNFYNPKED